MDITDRTLSVSDLNNHIKSLLENDNLLTGGVRVRGELSNYKIYPSGHHYFTMKDTECSLRCVMFRGSASKLRYSPQNGMSVVAFGNVTVYPRDGAYQLYVSDMNPEGVGDLHIAFQQLYAKLEKEGLFDDRHKKPLPRNPGRIAVITSPAGAAVRDIIKILRVRWPMSKVIVIPVRVQGAEAPPEIAEAIAYANAHNAADVIITGRGGGSLEDLWAFNDERVARAIFNSTIPVISAVGHEPDVTIADSVADVKASTPSNAAELAVPDQNEMRGMLLGMDVRARQSIERALKSRRQRIEALSSKRVLQSPKHYVDDKRLMLDHSHDRLHSALKMKISRNRESYARLAAALDAMSPLKVLGRGYAIARREDGRIIKSASDISSGDRITVRLKTDEIQCVVNEMENNYGNSR